VEVKDVTIRCERLEMPLLSLDQLERLTGDDAGSVASELNAVLSPEWLASVGRIAAYRARQIREHPTDAPWLFRPILLRDAGQPRPAIGYLNFHGAPDERGMLEIGYTLLPEARGQGYAIEAVRAAFEWATRVHGIRHFRASVSPDNDRSLNLIGKLGFVQTGDQWDEVDGLELVFELRV
jgi:RimJ/RimL family protein N-acetyltransferase